MYKNWIYIEKFSSVPIFIRVSLPLAGYFQKPPHIYRSDPRYDPRTFIQSVAAHAVPCAFCLGTFFWNVFAQQMIFHTKIDVVLSVDNLVCEKHKAATCGEKKRHKKKTQHKRIVGKNEGSLISYPFNPTFERRVKLQLVKTTPSPFRVGESRLVRKPRTPLLRDGKTEKIGTWLRRAAGRFAPTSRVTL